MYMVGMLLGAITIGDLADRLGRKVGILVSVLLLGGGGVLSAFSPNYTMFLIMRLLTGAGGVGLFQVTFVLGKHVCRVEGWHWLVTHSSCPASQASTMY